MFMEINSVKNSSRISRWYGSIFLLCGLSQSVDWLLFWGWGLLFNVIVDYVRI